MSDNPIKFQSSPSSSKDELPSHHSSKENIFSVDEMSDYSPLWSSEKEDPEEDEDDVDTDVKGDEDDSDDNSNDSDSVSNFASPPPKRERQAYI
jgi:hypothetical protein